jgi:uncharacterized protein YbaR (Trm112 family)
MAADSKDRLGSKIHDVEAAREDQWARQHDEKLLDEMRKRLENIACPHCKQVLVAKTEEGVHMMACPKGDGAWLDASALKHALKQHK